MTEWNLVDKDENKKDNHHKNYHKKDNQDEGNHNKREHIKEDHDKNNHKNTKKSCEGGVDLLMEKKNLCLYIFSNTLKEGGVSWYKIFNDRFHFPPC